MFHKILIANRGEIALRILKTLKKLNIKSVAIYSPVDKNMPFVSLADEAYPLENSEAKDSYLNIAKIISIAKAANVDAIHPGYGFLAENPEFAQKLQENNITFIGPQIETLKLMGSKQLAKQTLKDFGINLIEGYHDNDQDEATLKKAANKIGWPVLLKAAAGGGGKGMRVVEQESDFHEALLGAKREALAFFKDDTVIIEKYLPNPRHIEVQILSDQHGNTVHIFERDCSIQRRHQKIIEEAPAPNLNELLLQKLREQAVKIAQVINYTGAGTIEFLVDGENFYFMEMNTRLQVEHPVTEMITGLDLVELQIKVAANEPLPFAQNEISYNGHAIELRIYAEDPDNQFMPSTGTITFLKEPTGNNIRIDSAIIKNNTISIYYDPLIAKIIAFGEDRTAAVNNLKHALQNYYIGGVKTNIPFLKSIIDIPDFINANLSTNFLNNNKIKLSETEPQTSAILAAGFDYYTASHQINNFTETFAWQMNLKTSWKYKYFINNAEYILEIFPIDAENFKLRINNAEHKINVFSLDAGKFSCRIDGTLNTFYVENNHENLIIYTESGNVKVDPPSYNYTKPKNLSNSLTAPMSSKVVAVIKNSGDLVKKGDSIIVLEAMKMEHTIYAHENGILTELYFDVGDQVPEGSLLGNIEPKYEENHQE